MTDDKIALQDLLEKSSDASLLREMIGFAAQRLMALEPCTLRCRPWRAHSDRINHRNGFRDRDWETRAAPSSCAYRSSARVVTFPGFLEPRRHGREGTDAVIQEAYVHGISTRSVDDLVQAMGCSGVSKSQVSRLMRRHRRTCAGLPASADRRRLAVCLARRNLREGAPERPHHLGGGHYRGRREQRRPP